MHALYGLTWFDIASNHPSPKLRFKAIQQMRNAWTAIDSPLGKMPFQEDLPVPYGAFYSGWSHYLLGKLLMLQRPNERDTILLARFNSACEEIAAVMNTEVFPESYGGMRWPADGMIAVACLSLHDKIFTPRYQNYINYFIARARDKVDHNGLIPHRCDEQGNTLASARGSSQSLILNLLLEIDATFAQEQFKIYRAEFLDSHFGLHFIREYPKGETGNGDIDSGPVLWDVGSAGTIVGLRTLTKFGHASEANCISRCIDAFGFPSDAEGGKYYLFGQLAMADVFIAWVKSSENPSTRDSADELWLWKFHGYSMLLIILPTCCLIWCWRQKI